MVVVGGGGCEGGGGKRISTRGGPGGCRVVVAQWQRTGGYNQTAWVRFPATASFFFLQQKKLIY